MSLTNQDYLEYLRSTLREEIPARSQPSEAFRNFMGERNVTVALDQAGGVGQSPKSGFSVTKLAHLREPSPMSGFSFQTLEGRRSSVSLKDAKRKYRTKYSRTKLQPQMPKMRMPWW